MTVLQRDYSVVEPDVDDSASFEARMRAVVDALWAAFGTRADGDRGFSWVGFYLAPGGSFDGATAGADEMILGPREPKPACSPIGLAGACGRAFLERRTLVVSDVAKLGAGYIACDPRDRSEIVVPVFDGAGACVAVLDVDSFDVGAFTVHDAAYLRVLLLRSGVSAPTCEADRPAVV